MVTLGTGVGAGIIQDGKILRGINYAAGELGHMTIRYNGIPCNCGRRGCLEAYASGEALIAQTEKVMAKKTKSLLWELCRENRGYVNGKLVFDETKFRTALQTDPEGVQEAFAKATSTDANGNTTQGGLMVRIKSVMDKYGSMTGATKGILVERAGSIYAPTTVLSNSIQKQMERLDDYIERLQDKLETETDRYISQFTSLETLISQMNNQSSYLSSMFA